MTKNLNADSKTLAATTRANWRNWLQKEGLTETEIWLIFEREAGEHSLTYEEAVLEALCCGWIDSIIQRIDDRYFARKFTVRKDWQTWSESNRQRLRKLRREGAEFLPGVLERIPPQVFDETVAGPPAPGKKLDETPDWLQQMLQSNTAAWQFFMKLPASHQKRYLGWILDAKKVETQQRRAIEVVSRLEQGQELGQK